MNSIWPWWFFEWSISSKTPSVIPSFVSLLEALVWLLLETRELPQINLQSDPQSPFLFSSHTTTHFSIFSHCVEAIAMWEISRLKGFEPLDVCERERWRETSSLLTWSVLVKLSALLFKPEEMGLLSTFRVRLPAWANRKSHWTPLWMTRFSFNNDSWKHLGRKGKKRFIENWERKNDSVWLIKCCCFFVVN